MADNKKRRLTESTEEIQLLKDKLEILKELKTSCESSSGTKTLTLDELSLPFPCREVADLSPSSIQSNIESLVLEIAHSILAGNGSSFDVPSRSAANKLYVSELDRILLKDITAKIIQLIHQLSQKGMVVGRLLFDDNGDMIDCTKGLGGKAIPPNIDRVENMQSDALFILLVEKDASYTKLAEDRFYNRFPCIIVTAKGQPDVSTRLFLRKMKTDLKLPVLALVDSHPYGLKFLSFCIPDIKWLGVRPSDLDKYEIPEQCRLPMTEQDIKTAKDMLEEDFVKKNPGWVEELTLMLKTKQKADIQALSTFGFQYLTEVYLPLKLQQQDWL